MIWYEASDTWELISISNNGRLVLSNFENTLSSFNLKNLSQDEKVKTAEFIPNVHSLLACSNLGRCLVVKYHDSLA